MRAKRDENASSSIYKLGGIAVLLLVGIAWWLLSRGYGEVSPRGYEFSTALISACNKQDQDRLAKIAEQIELAIAAKEVPEYDARVLRDIVHKAQEGDWNEASASVRQLMNAQIDTKMATSKPFN